MTERKEPVEKFAGLLLDHARTFVEKERIPHSRLPYWVGGCDITIGKVNNTFVIQFKPNDQDTTTYFGQVKSDIHHFINIQHDLPNERDKDILPVGYTKSSNNGLVIRGSKALEKEPVITSTADSPMRFTPEDDGIHVPVFLTYIFMKYKKEGEITNAGLVPFGMLVHESDLTYNDELLDLCKRQIEDALSYIVTSEIGDYYETRDSTEGALTVGREKSVIVLGPHDEEQKLIQTRDLVRSKGYHAELVKNLPEQSIWSLKEKVSFWTLASRFCVMIDNKPSGHIAEYEIIEDHRTILALLRPKGSGSTRMFGEGPLQDINHVELFEYEDTPLEVIDDAVAWAEDYAQNRSELYTEHWEWRKS
ncbi:hypothetical protein [Salinigranum sp. GCM10025319]|uniref:hypothetical protein n=1 Tax=Salinigranum sp. GCM10025319 TaxID=3252687 RepID=UPI00360A2E77